MRRIRGKHEELTLLQFCNDWFMAQSATIPNLVLRPTQVELDDDEMGRVLSVPAGTLWREYEPFEHTPGAWRFRAINGGRS